MLKQGCGRVQTLLGVYESVLPGVSFHQSHLVDLAVEAGERCAPAAGGPLARESCCGAWPAALAANGRGSVGGRSGGPGGAPVQQPRRGGERGGCDRRAIG